MMAQHSLLSGKGSEMVTNDVQDELAEGFEVAPMPPIGKDGSLELPPMRAKPRPHPRLCEAGPCRNYHQFTIQMDAQKPRDEKQPDGTLAPQPSRFHTEVHHYCYPNVGIESRLGSLPVIQCNRWSPILADEINADQKRADLWLESAEGVAYSAELAAWRAEREAEDAEIDAAAAQAAEDLANMPEVASDPGGCVLVVGCQGTTMVYQRVDGPWPWSTTVREVITAAIAWGYFAITIDECRVIIARDGYVGPPVALDTTIGHAGLTQGDRLVLLSKTETGPVAPIDLGGEG